MPPPILFIQGPWLPGDCWAGWRARYVSAGKTCLEPLTLAPGDTAAPYLGSLIDAYAARIAGLAEGPVLIGHSFGGLIVQSLLDRGLGKAGISLAGWSPRARKRIPGTAALRAALRLLVSTPADLPLQNLPGLLPEALFSRHTAIRPANDRRPPLLLIAGSQDRVVTPDMVQQNHQLQLRGRSETSFRNFSGRGHLLVTEPGWPDIADYCLAWADTRTLEP
ncbi:alpha/beta hydrolase [Pelagibius sp. 7325]|uniref:alpha/beta hydrolase n=1 Tax=Pelagibius sp. 7325 TaxID=3131994 RepID=UPI0030EBE268